MIYLASPYSDPDRDIVLDRVSTTKYTTALLIKQGLPIFSPIVHCHELATSYDMPTHAAHWEAYNTSFIRKCDYLIVLALPSWISSLGVTQERRLAKSLGIPIVYYSPAGDRISYTEALELD